MPIAEFVYTVLNEKYVQIGPIVDGLNPTTLITDGEVMATLYKCMEPGGAKTPIAQMTNLSLEHVGGGVYRGLMNGADFNPPLGSDYYTVIDMTTPEGGQAHWEIRSLVIRRSS